MKTGTLYVSDMDGTLLSSDSRISAFTAASLQRLADSGILFTVATARTAATVEPLLNGITTAPYAVVMTGAALWHRPSGSYTDCRFLAPELQQLAIATCHNAGIYPFVYTLKKGNILDVYHAGATLNNSEEIFYKERCNLPLKRFHLSTPPPDSAATKTLLLFAMGPRKDIELAANGLKRLTPCYVSCYPDIFDPETAFLEIFSPGVSKASAINMLKEKLGAEKLTVFGDNLNDLPMFDIADTAVAVANAQDAVCEAADIRIGPNTDDSVARYILTKEAMTD